jgi:hypothetical protein
VKQNASAAWALAPVAGSDFAALPARDWAGARACLVGDLQAVWWTGGERFSCADALIEVNKRYPEGWTIPLLEVEHLQDGRVMLVARADHPRAQIP